MPFGRLRHVARRLLRAPLFTAISLLTLGLGIGGNTAVFTVVHGVLLKPLPFEDAERLVGVWHTAPGIGFDEAPMSPALHFTYQEQSQVFERIGMWDPAQVAVTGDGPPERVEAMRVTEGTLPTLRVKPTLGRVFTVEDDSPGTPEAVMISHGYWQSHLAGDPGALGKVLTVDGVPREIVGVLPADLHFLDEHPQIFLPMRFDLAKVFFGNFSYQGVARLKPGVSIAQANQDLTRLIPVAAERFRMPDGFTIEMLREAHLAPNVRPLMQDAVGDIGNVLWVLLGTVGIVLLIACANVANLFLARAEGRQQEIAVRTAMGASRGRLALELMRESLVLAVLGGVVGCALAWAGVRILVALKPEHLPRLDEISIDASVLLFNLGISVLAGLVLGLLPVLKLRTAGLITGLKEGGRGSHAGRERHRARSALVVAQVALALVLLIGSGLLVRSFQAMSRVDPGFARPDEILTLRVSIPSAEVESEIELAQTYEILQERLAKIPGVTSAGASTSVTMDGSQDLDPIFVEDFPVDGDQLPPLRRLKWVTPGYFATMGNPVVAGRDYTWADLHDRTPLVIVTENFASKFWGTPAAALGKRIKQSPADPWREIVGVVGDVHDAGVDKDATIVVYWPMVLANFWEAETWVPGSLVFTLRSPRVGSADFLNEVRDAVWSVNPNLPLANVRTQADILEGSMARSSFTLVLLGVAAGVALLLGAVGVYGVATYTVAQRTREIGVRMVLGARRWDVSRMVLREGLVLGALGVVLGIAGAVGLTRLMASLLFGVSPRDVVTFAAAALVLPAIVLVASFLPALRAASVNPIEAMRWE